MANSDDADFKATIVAVDDNPAVLEIVEAGLTRRGYRVTTVQSGSKAIDLLSTMTPDMILCDISMPEVDGKDVLRAVRANPQSENIPFIFLTAFGDHEIVQEAVALGASGYIGKPFKIKELVAALEEHLNTK